MRLSDDGRRAHRHAGELFAPILGAVADVLGADVAATQRSLNALHGAVGALDPSPVDARLDPPG